METREGRAVPLGNIGELTEPDLLAIACAHQSVSYLMCVAAGLGLHSDHQIDQLLPLNNLCYRPPTDCGRNHSFHVHNADPIPRNLVPIDKEGCAVA